MRGPASLIAIVSVVATFPGSFEGRGRAHTPTIAEALAAVRAEGLTSDPTAVSWGSGRLDVFARGADNALWHKWFDGQWSGWESLGGSLASGPDVTSWGSGRLDVFARGTDNALLHRYYNGGWSGWESLGGVITSDPSAVAWGKDRIDVFARGGDNALWHIWFAGSWSGWEHLGGVLASGPDAASWGLGRLDVFAVGTDRSLQYKWYGGKWSEWTSLGGGLTSDPAAVSWGKDRIDVFARGGDNALWHIWYAGSWSKWEPLGGALGSGPDAATRGASLLDVFALGTDMTLYHKSYSGGWSGWESRGMPGTTVTTVTSLKTGGTLLTGTLSSGAVAPPTYQPPGTYYPPVSLGVRSWNPSLHEVLWDWDGVHGYSSFQVYKLDPATPSGRLVRDRSPTKGYMDSSLVAPNTTTYRVVGFGPDGSTWGSADIAYPNPPQPAAPTPLSGVQVSTGAVKLSWPTVPGAQRYRLFGPALPATGLAAGSAGMSNLPVTQVVTGIPLGKQTFAVAAEYTGGVGAARASTTVDVRPTSGRYRVLLKHIVATRESSDDPLSMDGRGDEIYGAAYWVTFPFYSGSQLNSGVVQSLVYGEVNQTSNRIQAGTASPAGGIRTGNVIPDGMAPIVQPGVQAYVDRLPLLVWQGTLQDSGQILVVHPTVWESDRNPTGNFPRWIEWWTTPNGRGAIKDKAYAAPDPTKPIGPAWLGYMDGNFPIQPGMDPTQGQDRPIGIGGYIIQSLGEAYISPNSNSLTPYGLVLTRERIERVLGGVNAILIPVTYRDKGNQNAIVTEYTVLVQVERMP